MRWQTALGTFFLQRVDLRQIEAIVVVTSAYF
jgi:hypothetical protein